MEALVIDPAEDDRWEKLVSGPNGSLFTSPPWLRAVRDTYGFVFRAAIVVAGEVPVSGFAWAQVSDVRGERVVALPFCDYADPILADAEHWPILSDAAFGADVPVRLRTRQVDPAGFDARLSAVHSAAWHGVDIARDPDAMWQSVDESARRAVRKAEKSGVTVRVARDVGDVRAFHRLHCGVRRRKYGLLAQPVALFENIWQQFTANSAALLLLAERDGMVVGGTYYLVWDDCLYYKFNASLLGGLGARPNDLLTWQGMVHGHQRGLRRFDFGQSDLEQEGLVRYKDKYATARDTITTYACTPAGWVDRTAEAGNDVLRALTDLLTGESVPDDLYERAGALLYRNFC